MWSYKSAHSFRSKPFLCGSTSLSVNKRMVKVSPYFTKEPKYLYDLKPSKVSNFFSDRFTICFVDVGIINLGFVVFSIDRHWLHPKIEYFEKVNLTKLDTSLTQDKTNELSDRVDRFAHIYRSHLADCEKLFIERQPISGIKVVEQLLFKKYREKAILISPISVHSFFKFGSRQGFDYVKRKLAVVKVGDDLISLYGTEQVKNKWLEMDEKKDDIGDPIVMAMYVIKKKRQEWESVFE